MTGEPTSASPAPADYDASMDADLPVGGDVGGMARKQPKPITAGWVRDDDRDQLIVSLGPDEWPKAWALWCIMCTIARAKGSWKITTTHAHLARMFQGSDRTVSRILKDSLLRVGKVTKTSKWNSATHRHEPNDYEMHPALRGWTPLAERKTRKPAGKATPLTCQMEKGKSTPLTCQMEPHDNEGRLNLSDISSKGSLINKGTHEEENNTKEDGGPPSDAAKGRGTEGPIHTDKDQLAAVVANDQREAARQKIFKLLGKGGSAK